MQKMTFSSIENFCIVNANNIANAQCEQTLKTISHLTFASAFQEHIKFYFTQTQTLGPKAISLYDSGSGKTKPWFYIDRQMELQTHLPLHRPPRDPG